jgi:hypothetical protein
MEEDGVEANFPSEFRTRETGLRLAKARPEFLGRWKLMEGDFTFHRVGCNSPVVL